jgi:hypothetical protein
MNALSHPQMFIDRRPYARQTGAQPSALRGSLKAPVNLN